MLSLPLSFLIQPASVSDGAFVRFVAPSKWFVSAIS